MSGLCTSPWLQSTRPAYTLLAGSERARLAIADLQVVRDDAGLAAELVVQTRFRRPCLRDERVVKLGSCLEVSMDVADRLRSEQSSGANPAGHHPRGAMWGR